MHHSLLLLSHLQLRPSMNGGGEALPAPSAPSPLPEVSAFSGFSSGSIVGRSRRLLRIARRGAGTNHSAVNIYPRAMRGRRCVKIFHVSQYIMHYVMCYKNLAITAAKSANMKPEAGLKAVAPLHRSLSLQAQLPTFLPQSTSATIKPHSLIVAASFSDKTVLRHYKE